MVNIEMECVVALPIELIGMNSVMMSFSPPDVTITTRQVICLNGWRQLANRVKQTSLRSKLGSMLNLALVLTVLTNSLLSMLALMRWLHTHATNLHNVQFKFYSCLYHPPLLTCLLLWLLFRKTKMKTCK